MPMCGMAQPSQLLKRQVHAALRQRSAEALFLPVPQVAELEGTYKALAKQLQHAEQELQEVVVSVLPLCTDLHVLTKVCAPRLSTGNF